VISIDDESSGQAAVGAAATLAAAGTFGGFAYASRLKFKQLQQLNADIDNKTAANLKLDQQNTALVKAVEDKKANLDVINAEIMANKGRASEELASLNEVTILNGKMKLEHDRLLYNLQTDGQALTSMRSKNEQVQQTLNLLTYELEEKKQTLNEVNARLAGHAELDREIREKTAKKQDLENQQQNLTQLVEEKKLQMQDVILSREQQLGNINAKMIELNNKVEELEGKKQTLTEENALLVSIQREIGTKIKRLEEYQEDLNNSTYNAREKFRYSKIPKAWELKY
jgi:chromosome segregation ATPase